MNRPLTRQEWREHLDATWKQCTGQEHMNLEDITRMARESGLLLGYPFTWEQLERFADLVAAGENEACAQVCDGLQDIPATEPRHCAQDIRLRMQK